MKNMKYLLVFSLVLIVLAGCAPGPNTLAKTPNEEGEVAGFWVGLWHGFIVPFTLIGSIFGAKVHIYEIHNSGIWYNVGFVIGASAIFGGGGGGAASRRCKN